MRTVLDRTIGRVCFVALSAMVIASTLGACRQGAGYSANPIKALETTKAYLEENPAYEAEQASASLSVGRIGLGKKLFFDKRLSNNGRFACATCHVPEQGYTQNDRALPDGTSAAAGGRNAPSLYDVVARSSLLRDGKASSLEAQASNPLLDKREMANSSMEALAIRVRRMRDYDRFFAYAYGGKATPERIAAALAAYERTLVTGPSRFDQWKYQGRNTLSQRQVDGYNLFVGKGGCVRCHTIGSKSAPLTDGKFHDTGYSATKPPEIAGIDTGRHAVTGDPADKFAFATPSLRNVALTGPYMHDGGLKTLSAVVDHFNDAGKLGLNSPEKAALVDFMQALTSKRRP